MKKFIFAMFLMIFCSAVFAAPKEIIIIRHGDKLSQPNPGPCLSPNGIMRSIEFAFYFLKKFGEPDFIFATDPAREDSSIRELQTVAPLANMLASKHPDSGFPILHPFVSKDYAKLAADLLQNKEYQNKTVLVCWNHTKIPQLAQELGVTQPIKKWHSEDFDSVYVLEFDSQGKMQKFTRLKDQYPLASDSSWEKLQKG